MEFDGVQNGLLYIIINSTAIYPHWYIVVSCVYLSIHTNKRALSSKSLPRLLVLSNVIYLKYTSFLKLKKSAPLLYDCAEIVAAENWKQWHTVRKKQKRINIFLWEIECANFDCVPFSLSPLFSCCCCCCSLSMVKYTTLWSWTQLFSFLERENRRRIRA